MYSGTWINTSSKLTYSYKPVLLAVPQQFSATQTLRLGELFVTES